MENLMIESIYWKNDLLNHAKKLENKKVPKRFYERTYVNFEKNIIISFFKIRKLIECKKITDKLKSHNFNIYKCSCLKNVNFINKSFIAENYDLIKEEKSQMIIEKICNLFIHSYTIYNIKSRKSENDEWGDFFVTSDRFKNAFIYRLELKEIIKIFKSVGTNYSKKFMLEYNISNNDYNIKIE
jgi:hypothetical protein